MTPSLADSATLRYDTADCVMSAYFQIPKAQEPTKIQTVAVVEFVLRDFFFKITFGFLEILPRISVIKLQR